MSLPLPLTVNAESPNKSVHLVLHEPGNEAKDCKQSKNEKSDANSWVGHCVIGIVIAG